MRLLYPCSLLLSVAAQACFFAPTGAPMGASAESSGSTGDGDPTDGGRCGDAHLDVGEECDYGEDNNGQHGSVCRDDCVKNVCGDGYVAITEGCDDGNAVDDDACSNLCTSAGCGDGVVTPPEQCDDGGQQGGACGPLCKLPTCGDGELGADEQCDDGVDNGDERACTLACEAAVCGDGKLHVGVESCDDGNDVDDDECRNTCTSSQCGDGVVQAPEACDDGNRVSTDACTTLCQAAACGDGAVQRGEECDLGPGNSDGAACTKLCKAAVCGDTFVQDGQEECDDGNDDDNDACTSACAKAVCGDKLLQVGVEECDDGNQIDGDGCNDCSASCGDGVLNDGEACDDGNLIPDDTCDASCERTAFLVFVTSAKLKSDFGSTSGADERCRELANAAKLTNAQRYRAWISDPDGSPSANFHKSSVPYMRLDKKVVADDWTDLSNGGLDVPISVTENGTVIGGGAMDCSNTEALVWTDTSFEGQEGNDEHCDYWNSTALFEQGGVGHLGHINGGWTDMCVINCDKLARLYCVEQP